MNKFSEARDFIIDEIKNEVFGPEPIGEEIIINEKADLIDDDSDVGYGPFIECKTGQEILGQETPSTKYGSGVLYPVGYNDPSSEETNIAGVTSDNIDEQDLDVTDYEESEDNIKFSATEEIEFQISEANKTKYQSTIGVSFYCELNEGDKIVIQNPTQKCGAYTHFNSLNGKKTRNGYFLRRDVEFKATFLVDDTYLSKNRIIKKSPEIYISDSVINLEYGLFLRQNKNRQIITATITNRTSFNSDPKKKFMEGNAKSLFQSGFRVMILDQDNKVKSSFLPYPKGEIAQKKDSQDEEESMLELIYKNKMNFAIGHGCTPQWHNEMQKCNLIKATCFPVVELPNITAEILSYDFKIPMNVLAGIVDGDKFKILDTVAQEYMKWINNEEKKILELNEKYTEAAKRNIEDCNKCLKRIIQGIEFLRDDSIALKAFELTNEAILIQQFRLSKPLREVSLDKNNEVYYATPISETDIKQSHDRIGNWRPFQLAFLLSSIKSSVLENDAEREDVELIFFPTGGGKTEAYLGLSAFCSFYRRLKDKDDNGVHTIMRYTLRLLTTQQFTRASGVICAMEFIRRREENLLGSNPFSIGLWVGGNNTPNRNKKSNGAISEYRNLLRKKKYKYRFVISKCPWCAAEIGKIQVVDQRIAKLVGLDEKDDRVIFAKHDPNCEFNEGLPIYVVDEDIYEEKPTIIIATVDKFAQLAWSPTKIREMFGISENGERVKPPPSLILQDELHLITGPLGSMVGMYEILIEDLCSQNVSSKKIKPKIICSTATIRSYKKQIQDLYDRKTVHLFPPFALDASDSFFSKYAFNKDQKFKNPKKYVGLMTPNYPSPQTTQVRIYSRLLYSANKLPNDLKDPFFTLMNFFGSIREIQNTHSLIQVDIETRLKFLCHRYGEDYKQKRRVKNFIELTSRIPSEEVPATIKELERKYDPNNNSSKPLVDICNASNIIEVGIDMLSLLTVLGQPKTTSSYIQVTGRIGRKWEERPGVVFTIYNNQRPRDKSHFEQFTNYHNKLYAQVEPMSVTPFASPVVRRALHAVAIAYVRIYGKSENSLTPEQFPKDVYNSFRQIILNRIKSIDPKELDLTEKYLNEIEDNWKKWKPQRYELNQQENDGLMYRSGTYVKYELKNYSYETPTSLRNVDAECRGQISLKYMNQE